MTRLFVLSLTWSYLCFNVSTVNLECDSVWRLSFVEIECDCDCAWECVRVRVPTCPDVGDFTPRVRPRVLAHPPARFTYFADLCDFSIFISRTFRFLPPPLPPPPPPPLLALHLCATPSSPSQLTPFLSPECDVAYSCDYDCSRSVVRRFRNWKSWCSHVIQYPATWKSSLEDDGIGLAGFWFWYWWLRNVRTILLTNQALT